MSSMSRRAGLAYHTPTGLFWVALTVLYAVITWWGAARAHMAVTATADTVLFIGAGLCCFVAVMDAEDAWNNFRRQKRLAVICGLLLTVSLAAGLTLGWWAAA
ncbi:hypothetical protein AB0F72_37920 [Actinoplanes sp. NPDC023936]|uniref:hypothetical protein n=1 Tax=Actinoplanes sp. NPDC023936 TaxID=3154910 RepID=UPI0033DE5B04